MSRTQIVTSSDLSTSVPLSSVAPDRAAAIQTPTESTLERRLQSSTPQTSPQATRTETSDSTKHSTSRLRLLSCVIAFLTVGINDGSLGPLLPYLLRYYALPTSSASFLYLSAFMGWFVAALTSNHVNTFLGTPGSLFVGSILQNIAQALRGWAPPFVCFAVSFGVASLGQAFQDASANTYVASVGNACVPLPLSVQVVC